MDTKGKKKNKKQAVKLDSKTPDDIKEKVYTTRQVDTSITLLDSPEDEIVVEALLFLSKYADIKLNNLNYLQQKGLMQKLLDLIDKNVLCLLRLSLRLLNILLGNESMLYEIDQQDYDAKILKISNFIEHSDLHIRQFGVNILSKLVKSCRITCLILKEDIFRCILQTVKISKDKELLTVTLELLLGLLSSPLALATLLDTPDVDFSVILKQLKSEESNIQGLVYDIFDRLSNFNIDSFYRMFREAKLVEITLATVLDEKKKEFHCTALSIIQNCMNSDETNRYFIESIEFLSFCQWVKTCETSYLPYCADIFQKLSRITSIRQVLFDLSVEDSILSILRTEDSNTLEKTCEAVSNMIAHKYCCERMLTPALITRLLEILEGDCYPNETGLQVLSDFARKSPKTLEIIDSLGATQLLLNAFEQRKLPSENANLRLLEILYKLAVHPVYQKTVVTDKFFEELLSISEKDADDLAALSLEILSYFVESKEFIKVFLETRGPARILERLKITKNPKLFKALLIFVYSSMCCEDIILEYTMEGNVELLKTMPESVKSQAPMINRILSLSYDVYLPLKFYEFEKLGITEKIENKFYIISGCWTSPFPFLELLLANNQSTVNSLYVVLYNLEPETTEEAADILDRGVASTNSDALFLPCLTNIEVRYGTLSPDPYLPRYIRHVQRLFDGDEQITLKAQIELLAKYVDSLMCGDIGNENGTTKDKTHNFRLHIECLKYKLGINIIPIGFLRMGFHCERALLFKALADKFCIPCTLEKGRGNIYWNEVVLLDAETETLTFFVVDLMNNVGELLVTGSREANFYCDIKT